LAYHSGNKRKPVGVWLVENMVRAFIAAAFVLVLMPHFIAPWLGVTPDAYAAQEVLWTLAGIFVGLAFSVPFTRLIVKSIRGGGGEQ
jgi:hypothetical protein